MNAATRASIALALVGAIFLSYGCSEDDGGVTDPLPNVIPDGDFRVEPNAEGDMVPIQAVVDQASAGDVIVLMPGIYHGTLNIDRPVHLLGAGGIDHTLLSAEEDATVVSVDIGGGFSASDSLIFEGLTIGDANRGVVVDASTVPLVLRATEISGHQRTGLQIGNVTLPKAAGGPELCVWRSFFDNNGLGADVETEPRGHQAALWVASTLMARSVFFDGNAVDIALTDGGLADVERMTAESSAEASLYLAGAGTNLDLMGESPDQFSEIRNGDGWGIIVEDGARLEMQNYVLLRNGAGGIQSNEGVLSIRDTRFEFNVGYGIQSVGSSDSLTNVSILNTRRQNNPNAGWGIDAVASPSGSNRLVMNSCIVRDSYREGIRAQGAGYEVEIESSTINGNGQGWLADAILNDSDPPRGGGVRIADGADLELSESTLSGNFGVTGGGVGALSGATATLTANSFSSNTASEHGAGVGIDGGVVTIGGGTFASNKSSLNGGAVAVLGGGDLTMAVVRLTGNTAVASGAGMYVFESRAVLLDLEILSNRAEALGAGQGGGIFFSEADLTLGDCLFSGNAADLGGAIYAAGLSQPITIDDCQFIANRGGSNAGTLYALDVLRDLTLDNCLIAASDCDETDPGTASAVYSQNDLPGGRVVLQSCTVADGIGGEAAIVHRSGEMSIIESVVAFNNGGGLLGTDLGFVQLDCNDFFDNGGLNYGLGTFIDPSSINEDPLFCDPGNGLYTVDSTSGLLAANNGCGVRIGAFGQGCDTQP